VQHFVKISGFAICGLIPFRGGLFKNVLNGGFKLHETFRRMPIWPTAALISQAKTIYFKAGQYRQRAEMSAALLWKKT
jgi:hypothetical protein